MIQVTPRITLRIITSFNIFLFEANFDKFTVRLDQCLILYMHAKMIEINNYVIDQVFKF